MKSDVLTVTLGAAQAITLFTVFAPKPNDIHKASIHDTIFANDLRRSELIAGGIGLALAGYVSLHTKSVEPLIVSGLAILALTGVYEYQLRQNSATPPLLSTLFNQSEYSPVPLTDLAQGYQS